MQSRDFCFWLQGFFELGDNAGTITAPQAAIIQRHLNLVFAHEIAPSFREQPAPPVPGPVVPPLPEPLPQPLPAPDPVPVVPPQPPRC